jgi:4-hydroxybenzoyl-CoA reductase subunit beta
MPLPKFEYFEPKTVEEALHLLSQYKGEAKVIAGGTDLLVRMNQSVATPSYLINLKHIQDLNTIIHDHKEGLRIGALTTLHAVETSEIIMEKFSVLAQAASRVASPQIRNTGTIGGNICLDTRCWYYNQSHRWRQSIAPCFKVGGDLCHVVKKSDHCYSLFSADTVPALIGLGAKIKISSAGDERVIPLEAFYTGVGQTVHVLQPDEIVTELQVPNPPPATGGVYLKYSTREVVDFPILGVAAVMTLGSNNRECTEARIVLGAVSSAPVRATKAEDRLRGKEIEDDQIEEIAEGTVKEAGPIVHMGTSVNHKRRMMRVFVKRAIKQALGCANSA